MLTPHQKYKFANKLFSVRYRFRYKLKIGLTNTVGEKYYLLKIVVSGVGLKRFSKHCQVRLGLNRKLSILIRYDTMKPV